MTSTEIAIPGTGEVVYADDPIGCVGALVAVRELESMLREAKGNLSRAIAEYAAVQGVKTLPMPDGTKATVEGGSETVYDAEAIEAGLREAGMPEERIAEIVVPTVTFKVSAMEAKRASLANPAYRAVIEKHRTVRDKPTYITIRRSA